MSRLKFYKDKKVLITGSTGFVGSWLIISLSKICKDVLGIGLEPLSSESMFKSLKLNEKYNQIFLNINDRNKVNEVVESFQPDIVFHLAAQPLVRLSYEIPIETYSTNVIGTLNVLDALRRLDKYVNTIVITTDKCYLNNESGKPFKEDDHLGGFDPYSGSKAACEIAVRSFHHSFPHNLSISTARAGNIIGGGDWSQDRIVVDLVKSLLEEKPIYLRNPNAIRPWQHVIDIIDGYLMLGEYNHKKSDFSSFNFGPSLSSCISVENLTKKFIKAWGKEIEVVVNKDQSLYESTLLKLDVTKAEKVLGWNSEMNIDETIQFTAEWYKAYYETSEKLNSFNLTESQIKKRLKII